jgi:hypothetical protein
MPADTIFQSDNKVDVAILVKRTTELTIIAVGFFKEQAGTPGNPLDGLIGLLTHRFLRQLEQFEDKGLQETDG